MTENKRFYLLNYKNNPIYDSLKDKEYNARYKTQRGNLCDLLNALHEENECLKEKLCELGISDVKCYGERIDTGLEEWLE